MSDTTPAPTVEPVVAPTVAAPLVAPDLSAATLENVAAADTKALFPFIPYKVRAAIYVAAPIVAVVASTTALVLRGEIGNALETLSGVAVAVLGATGLSHVAK